MNIDTEVLFVGGSPVGLTLASDLAGCSEPKQVQNLILQHHASAQLNYSFGIASVKIALQPYLSLPRLPEPNL